jgi:hypothetical protein
MYIEFPHDINPPADPVEDWAMNLDAYLDTPEGLAWLKQQEDVESMRVNANRDGVRPGLGGSRHG